MVIALARKLGDEYLMIPIVLAVVGYVASIIGVFSITAMKNMDPVACKKHHFHRCALFIGGGYLALDSWTWRPGNLRCGNWITRGYPDWFGN